MYCKCGKITENKETGLCASCALKARKEIVNKSKERQKREKSKGIRKISKKLGKQLRVYSKNRLAYMVQNPTCKAKLTGCTKTATDIHHTGKRGNNLNELHTWLPVCRNCHDQIEFKISAAERRKRGFLL